MRLQRYRKGVPPTLTIKYLGLHSTFLTHTAAIITSIFKFQPCTPASSNTTEILDFNSKGLPHGANRRLSTSFKSL